MKASHVVLGWRWGADWMEMQCDLGWCRVLFIALKSPSPFHSCTAACCRCTTGHVKHRALLASRRFPFVADFERPVISEPQLDLLVLVSVLVLDQQDRVIGSPRSVEVDYVSARSLVPVPVSDKSPVDPTGRSPFSSRKAKAETEAETETEWL